MSAARAVVTGASGFVGRALMRRLGVARALAMSAPDWMGALEAGALSGATIYHLAARVHSASAGNEQAYLHDNGEKTRLLARRAAEEGAHAFIFLSSIKVNGDESSRPFRAEDEPQPQDPYARSKLAGERALAQIARDTGLAVAIVRAPLVYGAGARGNLEALLRLADTPWPLPFALLRNRRSFVHVEDLCDLLAASASHATGFAIYLAAHREPISTATLVRLIRRELGRPGRLFPMPAAMLEAAASIAGQRERVRRLTRSLEVDPSAAESALGWSARVGIDRAVREMVAAYRERRPA